MPAFARQSSLMMATDLERSWPRNSARREGPGLTMATLRSRRTGRAQDHLGHPYEKAVSADRDHRPDESGNDREYEKFRTSARRKHGLRCRLRTSLTT
jgi:hypothetical protein